MKYCGVVPTQSALQLAMLEEVRTPEPPVRLSVMFFEPGSPAQVAAELRSLGAVVVGVSTDDVTTHAEFTRKYKIPYTLLSDKDGQLAAAFDVPLRGSTTPHATFVIDRGGTIRKVFRKVRPWGHSAEVLAAVKDVAR
jgi:peroxiredoxin